MSEAILREYQINAEIGCGRFDVFRHCLSLATGDAFAVKSVDQTLLSDALDHQLIHLEPKLSLLTSATPNTVHTHAVFEDPSSLHIAMDLCSGPALFDRFSYHGPLIEPKVVAIVDSLMTAIAALHRRGMVHRDINTDNILFDVDDQLHLSDFIFVTCFEYGESMDGIVGTAYYMAPEVVVWREYWEKVGIWSAWEVFEAAMMGNPMFPARPFREFCRRQRI